MAISQDRWGGQVTRFLDELPATPCISPPPPSFCSICGRLNRTVALPCRFFTLMYDRERGPTSIDKPVRKGAFSIDIELEEEEEDITDAPMIEFSKPTAAAPVAAPPGFSFSKPAPATPASPAEQEVEVVEVEAIDVIEEPVQTPKAPVRAAEEKTLPISPAPPVKENWEQEKIGEDKSPAVPRKVVRKMAKPVQKIVKTVSIPAPPPTLTVPSIPAPAHVAVPPKVEQARVPDKPASPPPVRPQEPQKPVPGVPEASRTVTTPSGIRLTPSPAAAPARPQESPAMQRAMSALSTLPDTKPDEKTAPAASKPPVTPPAPATPPPAAPAPVDPKTVPPMQPVGRRTGGLYDILRKPGQGQIPAQAPPATPPGTTNPPGDKKPDEELMKKLRGMNPP